MLPGCQCVRPGNFMKCLDCPRFKVIGELLKEKVSSLQGLNRQELHKLLGDCELPLNYTIPRVVPITFKYEWLSCQLNS